MVVVVVVVEVEVVDGVVVVVDDRVNLDIV